METELNAKLARIHKIISMPYWFMAAFGLLMLIFHNDKEGSVGIGVFFIFLFVPLGLLHTFASKGARSGKSWGRKLSKVIGIILLFGFPLGTVMGYYILKQVGKNWEDCPTPITSDEQQTYG